MGSIADNARRDPLEGHLPIVDALPLGGLPEIHSASLTTLSEIREVFWFATRHKLFGRRVRSKQVRTCDEER